MSNSDAKCEQKGSFSLSRFQGRFLDKGFHLFSLFVNVFTFYRREGEMRGGCAVKKDINQINNRMRIQLVFYILSHSLCNVSLGNLRIRIPAFDTAATRPE